MSFCIKPNNFDANNILLGEETKLNNTIIRPLLYKYDANFVNKLNILTDFIHISSYKIKKYQNKKENIIFILDNGDILKMKQQIKQKIKFNIQNQNIQNDMINNYDSDSDISSESDNISMQIPTQTLIQDEPDIKNIEIITLNDNNNNHNNHDNDINDVYNNKHIDIKFNTQSKITLYPSKKSGLEPYDLIKSENYKEIDRYYPSFNKQGNFKIVGKFLISVNAYVYNNTDINLSYGDLAFNIKSGAIKYEKSYINDKLKAKNVFEEKIKIEI